MVNELPSNVGYGTVTGRFLLAYSDSSDSDLYPDGAPAKGSVLFTPSPNFVKNVTASPAPVTILPATISCDLDSEGYILGYAGTRGVRLVATDDAQNNPIDWTWKVTFRLADADGTPTRGIPDFSFELPQGTTVDLTDVMPVTGSNGTYYLVGPTGPSNVLSIGTVTQLESTQSPTVVITGTSPAQTVNFGIPKGAPNILNIGTVATGTPGTSASAEITGTTPIQTLNLTIPRGDKGETGNTGPANTLAVGSVLTGIAGSNASVQITGSAPSQQINFVIPQGIQGVQGIQGIQGIKGDTGATGINWQGIWNSNIDYINNDAVFYGDSSWFASGNPTTGEVPGAIDSEHWFPLALHGATGATGPTGPSNVLNIGTVVASNPGAAASATITGTSPSQTLNLVIPRGETGPQGPQGPAGNLGDLSGVLPITYIGSTIGFDPTYVTFIDGGTA
jgi:hypothetical protein